MSIFNMSDAEKKKILEKHQEATKNQYLKKEETKAKFRNMVNNKAGFLKLLDFALTKK